MPQLSLTDLVDVVSKMGTPKATKVRQIKTRPAYSPATDFYRPLRVAIADIHKACKTKKTLEQFVDQLKDHKKLGRYSTAAKGSSKWWRQKTMKWFEPPRTAYTAAGVDVIVNPELGLFIDDTPHLIKMYFKDEPLAKVRIDLITVLMEETLRPLAKHGEVMSVLDVNEGRLFNLSVAISPTKAMINAELAYVSALWPHV